MCPWSEAAGILLITVAFGAVFWIIKGALPLESLFGSVTVSGKALDGSVIESVILGCMWAILYFAVMFKPIKKKWRNLKVKD